MASTSAPWLRRTFNRQRVGDSGIYVAFALLLVVFALLSPFFLSISNFSNVLTQGAVLMIAAFAMTFIIISGEIDLSVSSLASLVGVVAALLLQRGVPVPLAVAAGLALGALAGLLNGVLTVKGKIPSFIVTLGTFSILRGVAFLLTGATAVPLFSDAYRNWLFDAQVLGVPISIVYVAATLGVLGFILRRTAFGNYVFAAGGNAAATRLAGINVDRVKILVFTLSGAVFALSGLMLTARLGTGLAESARNLELDAIAAVVLGGTSFQGGRGSLLRTVMGTLLIAVLNNGLTLLNVTYYAQLIIKGAIIIAAVLLDRWARGGKTA